jgi:hypothetical protein
MLVDQNPLRNNIMKVVYLCIGKKLKIDQVEDMKT